MFWILMGSTCPIGLRLKGRDSFWITGCTEVTSSQIASENRPLHSQPPDVPRQTPSQEPPFSVNGLQEPQGESTLPRSRFLATFVLADHRSTIIGRLSRDLLFLFTLCLVLAN